VNNTRVARTINTSKKFLMLCGKGRTPEVLNNAAARAKGIYAWIFVKENP
jgi:hypothetical protein